MADKKNKSPSLLRKLSTSRELVAVIVFLNIIMMPSTVISCFFSLTSRAVNRHGLSGVSAHIRLMSHIRFENDPNLAEKLSPYNI